jgi:hypothetical protein
MGYTTDFTGQIKVSPPLNEAEISYINDFNRSRRMHRTQGPYYAVPGGNYGQNDPGDVINYNRPGPEQPELWYQWVPTDDGTAIEWDGGEKFYSAEEWMRYLIDTFLKPGCTLEHEKENPVEGRYYDRRFLDFTFDHVLNGRIDAQGEEIGDYWVLYVRDNVVRRIDPTIEIPQTSERSLPEDVEKTASKLTLLREEDTTDGQPALVYNVPELTAGNEE